MQFDNSFEVPLPPDRAWPLLLDVVGIAPCMPGAELTEVVDASTYKGRIAVRLGPVALSFAGTVKIEDIDESAHTAKVRATGSDAKGRGGAQATAFFRLAASEEGTTVLVHTDLILSGAVAQYGRGVGVVQATAAQLMQQFADNLRIRIAEGAGMEPASAAPHIDTQSRAAPAQPRPASPPAAAKPISGFSLLWNVLWDSIKRMFGKTP